MTATRPGAWWVWVTLVPVLAVFAVCLVNALAWIGQPFSGFLIAENGIVVSIGRAEWTRARNRSVPFARVLALDGHPVSDGREIHAYVTAGGVGKPMTYTFRKGVEIFSLVVPVRLFGARDFLELCVPFLGVGLLLVVISAAVVALRPGAAETRALFALCLAIGLSFISAPDAWSPYWFTGLYFLSMCAVPPAFTLLALTYPQRSTLLRHGWIVYLALYLPFVGLGAALLSSMHDPSLFLPLLFAFYFLVANAALMCVGALVLGLIDGVRPREPVVLALGAMLGSSLIPASIFATYPLLQWFISPVWLFGPLLLLPVLMGLAFLRYPTPAAPAGDRVGLEMHAGSIS